MKEPDPFDIDGQQQQRDEAQKRARLAEVTEVDDLKWLLSSKRGRRILHRQLMRARVFHPSFNTNALQMAFAEGNRNQGLALLTVITEHFPERYSEMLQEAKSND